MPATSRTASTAACMLPWLAASPGTCKLDNFKCNVYNAVVGTLAVVQRFVSLCRQAPAGRSVSCDSIGCSMPAERLGITGACATPVKLSFDLKASCSARSS